MSEPATCQNCKCALIPPDSTFQSHANTFQAHGIMPTAVQTKTPTNPKKKSAKKNVCTAVGVKLAGALCKHSAP